MTIDEIIHVYENSRLVTESFTDEAVTAAYVAGLSALRTQQEVENLSADRDAWQHIADAAVRDIDHCCSTCQYHHIFFNGCTYDHDCTNPDGACSDDCDRWHWRGPCKENGGELAKEATS